MFWLILVISAYFFSALANIFDKFLLGSKRVSSAPVYAFYMGLFGLGSFLLAPLGLTFPNAGVFLECILSGMIFALGILLIYFAFQKAQASRVAPVVGAVVPIVTFILSVALGSEKLTVSEILGALLLILGGLLISFDLPLKLGKKKFFTGFYCACGAGVFLAVAYVFFKHISESEEFVTWYIWTRMGGLVGACLLLFIPLWRKNIFKSFHTVRKNTKHAVATSAIFASGKVAGGVSTLMLNYAIGLGSVTLANSLVAIQYIFVLLMAFMMSTTHVHVFGEKLSFWDWAQKIAAIAIIGLGMFFIY